MSGPALPSTASPWLPLPGLCPQISQVLGNEIKFAVREPLGLR